MTTQYPKFTASKFETKLITQIAQRACAMAKRIGGFNYAYQTALMDIEACHCNGCELDLQKLLDAPDGDFGHDVFGIRRFIDRRTGKLGGCFLPRCAMPGKVTADGNDK